MVNRYYNKVTGTEAIPGVHSIDLPDVVILAPSNPYWSALPPGQQLTYTADLPDGLEAIPAPVYTAAQQAAIDLRAAGVNVNTVTNALYANSRGITTPLATLDSAVDAVVLSSGLTLAQVSVLLM
jgi:hypothetical protein